MKDSTIYQPLDPNGGIRILILESNSDDAEICCGLILGNLDEDPEYKALSYEWGSPMDPKMIKLNGKSVSVTNNLWWALWHLRKNGRITRLWIDALCINQKDDYERGHQVSMMGSIYQNAEVICWLGRGNGNDRLDRAMRYLGTTPQKIESQELLYSWETNHRHQPSSYGLSVYMASPRVRNDRKSSLDRYPRHHPGEYETQSSPNDCLSNLQIFLDIEALCSHTYWRRTWIIQEVVLGKKLTIWQGDVCIDEIRFFGLCKRILLQNLSEQGVLMIEAFRILHLRQHGRSLTLIQLMEFSELSSCQDLRDRVYAMLSLASDCQQITPDYTKSIEDVYKYVMLMYTSDIKQNDSRRGYSIVYISQLVQRAFWPLSASVLEHSSETPGTETQKKSLEEPIIEIGGVDYGTISGPCKSNPEDLWWAHPGLVKPMASSSTWSHSIYLPQSTSPKEGGAALRFWMIAAFGFISLFMLAFIDDPSSFLLFPKNILPFSFIAAISIAIILMERRYGRQVIQVDEHNPVQCFQVSGGVSHIYAPPNTRPGDTVCRFQNSGIVAIVRIVKGNYTLVGRAMIIDGLRDVAVFSERTFTDEAFENLQLRTVDTGYLGNSIGLTVTLTELRDLTFPYY
ncbi:heterokaryon incompatibility protein-domain-containing protein [Tricladium varicosporioides]|nr:heterokaryon incompatibility protein-domain-containing protein [Hymenoscyphus varicosporioides]